MVGRMTFSNILKLSQKLETERLDRDPKEIMEEEYQMDRAI